MGIIICLYFDIYIAGLQSYFEQFTDNVNDRIVAKEIKGKYIQCIN